MLNSLPLWNETPIWASRTLEPPHHCSSETESGEWSCLSHPCGSSGPMGTSRHSCPWLPHPSEALLPVLSHDPPGQSSNPSRISVTHRPLDPLHFPGGYEHRVEDKKPEINILSEFIQVWHLTHGSISSLFTLITQHTLIPEPLGFQLCNLQVECLIVLGGPVVAFRLGCELPLLITLMWANHGHFHKRPEHTRCLPLEVIGCYHYRNKGDLWGIPTVSQFLNPRSYSPWEDWAGALRWAAPAFTGWVRS